MVCVTYTAAVQVLAPAPVLTVTVTKNSETATTEVLLVQATFGTGSTTTNATVKVDGILKQYVPRVSNGTSAEVFITIPKTGYSHQICVE